MPNSPCEKTDFKHLCVDNFLYKIALKKKKKKMQGSLLNLDKEAIGIFRKRDSADLMFI